MQIKGYVEPQGKPVYFDHDWPHGMPLPGDEVYQYGIRYKVRARVFDYSDSRNTVVTLTLEEI